MAASGEFQEKGIGRTPIATPLKDARDRKALLKGVKEAKGLKEKFLVFYKNLEAWKSAIAHSHGGASLQESILEAIWGEILDRELPFGANRVAFVISTGTATEWLGPIRDPRAIIVRENPVRPAHFMKNYMLAGDPNPHELRRVEKLTAGIVDALPKGQDFDSLLTDAERLGSSVKQMVKQVSRQYASEYVRSIYHGATTPSNIEITGKALDHGTLTSLDGYPAATWIRNTPNGEVMDIYDNLLLDAVLNIRAAAAPELRTHIPGPEELEALIRANYTDQLTRDFLWIAGMPPELITEPLTPKGLALGRLLDKIAKEGNTELVDTRFNVPRNTGKYSFRDVVNTLASHGGETSSELSQKLSKLIPENNLRQELVKVYQDYRGEVLDSAINKGMSPKAFDHYLSEAARIRNKPLTDLFRGRKLWAKQYARIASFDLLKSPQLISNYIDETVRANSRTFPNTPPYSLILEEKVEPQTGTVLRKAFNALSGKEEVLLQTRISGAGVTNFLGKAIPAEELSKSTLVIDNLLIGKHTAQAEVVGDSILFRLPEFNLNRSIGLSLTHSGKVTQKFYSPGTGEFILKMIQQGRSCVAGWFRPILGI